jgi:hypothetical protein
MTKVIYKRSLKKSDFLDDDRLIFYENDNIVYIIVNKDSHYIIRKKKVFNGQIIYDKKCKTSEQILLHLSKR